MEAYKSNFLLWVGDERYHTFRSSQQRFLDRRPTWHPKLTGMRTRYRYHYRPMPLTARSKIASSKCFVYYSVGICHGGVGNRRSGNTRESGCIQKVRPAESGGTAKQVRAVR